MVLLQKIKNKLLIGVTDTLLQYNFEDNSTQYLKIPEPILPENLTKGQIQVLKKEVRTITSVASSSNADYIVVSTENKQVIVCDDKFNVVKNIIINRAASKVCFTPSNDILIADKTGDVFLYPFTKENSAVTLLFGHLSVILDLIVSSCGKYVITCDRDEKIRVSCFPNAYNIASFCLGHKEFVKSVKLFENILISASGDGTVRFWDYLNGAQLSIVDTCNLYEKDSFKAFSEQMDIEKVDVLTLPILDVQVSNVNGEVFIAISLYNCDLIYVYKFNKKTLKSEFLMSVSTGSKNFSFCFSEEYLYILSDKMHIYKLCDNKFIDHSDDKLDEFCEKYKELLKITDDNSVTALYKRKFDNVQEYLDRKRQRLEAKI